MNINMEDMDSESDSESNSESKCQQQSVPHRRRDDTDPMSCHVDDLDRHLIMSLKELS